MPQEKSVNARAIAAQILYEVAFEQCSLTEALEITALPEKDSGFIKEICFGALRFWIVLQAFLKEALNKPLKNDDKIIECLLCVGLYQLFYMDVPDYAAVNETVAATNDLKKSWASKLVNKILHMAIDSGAPSKGITIEYAHPNWIIDKIRTAYPQEWESILNANNQKAPLFLRVNQTQLTRDDFLSKLSIAATPITNLSHGVCIEEPVPVEKITGFLEGYFSVQDASGQAVMDYLDLQPDQMVLDACAAPGSKTTHILETMPTIKQCVAVDLYPQRLKKVVQNVRRLKLDEKKLRCVANDILDVNAWSKGETFDRILLDAPCSASGVIRRHPDIKLLRIKTDIPALAATQLLMLKTLWPLLKPEGKLVYTTCSVFPEENSDVIKTFLNQTVNAKLIDEKQVLPSVGDGFYYAVFVNTSQ